MTTTTNEIIRRTTYAASGKLYQLDEAFFTEGLAKSPSYILGYISKEIEDGIRAARLNGVQEGIRQCKAAGWPEPDLSHFIPIDLAHEQEETA